MLRGLLAAVCIALSLPACGGGGTPSTSAATSCSSAKAARANERLLADVAALKRAARLPTENRLGGNAAINRATDRFINDVALAPIGNKQRNRMIDHAVGALLGACEQCFQALEAARPIPSDPLERTAARAPCAAARARRWRGRGTSGSNTQPSTGSAYSERRHHERRHGEAPARRRLRRISAHGGAKQEQDERHRVDTAANHDALSPEPRRRRRRTRRLPHRSPRAGRGRTRCGASPAASATSAPSASPRGSKREPICHRRFAPAPDGPPALLSPINPKENDGRHDADLARTLHIPPRHRRAESGSTSTPS